MRNLLLAGLILFSSSFCRADDYVWIIGGGPVLEESQGQIELNVKWIREVLGREAAGARVKVFYTDGDDPASDVVVRSADTGKEPAMQPLSRVFGQYAQNLDSYHNNTVGPVAGGTGKKQLLAALEHDFGELKPGDRALIVYNGHGSVDRSNTLKNALRLWQEERLDVVEFEALLSRIGKGVTVRYFFTQCYAGSFSQAMYRGADSGAGVPVPGRCGFLAEDEFKPAEGCSASINTEDYRDYTTTFFTALDGHTRGGQMPAGDRDVDGDGLITLYDGHLYSLLYGRSADIPRSTSEEYLLQWQPWYLRMLSGSDRPDNIYSNLADALAKEKKLSLTEGSTIPEILKMVRRYRGEMNDYWSGLADVRHKLEAVQKEVSADVKRVWPATIYPYTEKYAEFLRRDLPAVLEYVLRHPRYEELVALQEEERRILDDSLDKERELTHYEKILRMRRLAVALEQIQRNAGEKEKAAYDALLACEKSGL